MAFLDNVTLTPALTLSTTVSNGMPGPITLAPTKSDVALVQATVGLVFVVLHNRLR